MAMNGGGKPWVSLARIVRKTGEVEEVAPKATLRLREGDQLHTFTAGGAGYGDPLDRDPGLVLQDLLDRRVSLSSALEDYGVVIDSTSQQVDQDATGQRRSQMAGDRGPVDWTYDLGVELGRV